MPECSNDHTSNADLIQNCMTMPGFRVPLAAGCSSRCGAWSPPAKSRTNAVPGPAKRNPYGMARPCSRNLCWIWTSRPTRDASYPPPPDGSFRSMAASCLAQAGCPANRLRDPGNRNVRAGSRRGRPVLHRFLNAIECEGHRRKVRLHRVADTVEAARLGDEGYQ
jgi:hypothetical protein